MDFLDSLAKIIDRRKNIPENQVAKFKIWHYFVLVAILYPFCIFSYIAYLAKTPFLDIVLISTLWLFLRREIKDNRFTYVKFALLPIAINYGMTLLQMFADINAIPIFGKIYNKGLFAIYLLGLFTNTIVLPKKNKTFWIFLGIILISLPIRKFTFNATMNLYLDRNQFTNFDYFFILGFLSAPTLVLEYLGFMVLFRLNKSSLKNIGKLPGEKS